jgi:iron-sulfur cluster assembly protein
MLTLTDNAVAAIQNLTTQQDVPEGCGLRIGTDPAVGSLTLSLAPAPQAGDQILDTTGATVFLDSEAAPLLEDKALDATFDDAGRVQFTVAQQLD